MRTYLGLTRRAAIAVGVGAFAVGAAIGIAIPADPPSCGYVLDSASVGYVPASCEDAAIIAERMDAIRRERSSAYFECAATNGAPLTADACASYLAERDAIAAECGGIAAQDAYEACEAPARAAYRAGR